MTASVSVNHFIFAFFAVSFFFFFFFFLQYLILEFFKK